MMAEPDLTAIGRTVQDTWEAVRRIEARLDAMSGDLGQVKDELTAVAAIASRLDTREAEAAELRGER
jgi:hypothetical protein